MVYVVASPGAGESAMKARGLRLCAVLLPCALGLASTARAQNAAWNGTTGNFNAASNWLPNAAVPTGTAFFGTVGLPGVTFSSSTGIGGFTFNPGAQAFTFSSTAETAGVAFSGAGIVNNSSRAPAFNISNGGISSGTPGLAFLNAASAGNAVINDINGGVTAFLGNSTAGNAIITNSGGTAPFSGTPFLGTSTAGNAFITNNNNGITQFNQSTTAGNATFVNNGGNIANFNIARFITTITNPGGPATSFDVGVTAFLDTATAGSATIVNNKGGVTAFLGTSTAGSATIVTNAGGATFFTGSSSGGTAKLIVNGGTLDLTAHVLRAMPAGSLTMAAGSSYQIVVAPSGQSNALALSGPATLQGGTVRLAPVPGNYWRNPTYTIVNAASGVTGTFAGTNTFAFLAPTLAYDANNVYLSVSQSFARGGQTTNQRAVGAALDQSASTASGDFNTVIGALAVLNPSQGPAALTALSGQPYADFATVNVQTGYAFANAIGAQMAAAREGAPANRAVLAKACEAACSDAAIGAWISGLGATGSVQGDGNASTLTYTFGGATVGADYRLDPRVLLGASVGYVTGSQWVNGFDGNGMTSAFNASLYASFASAALYVDGLAGYVNATNQLSRYMMLPGLATRAANGQTTANQFLGQIEGGYRVGLDALAPALSVTPFARLQGSTTNQAGFSESGASSLSLLVAPQITNSLRSTLGADLRATVRQVDVDFRLGWLHEYADTSRPLTAAFAGAPGFTDTVFGATPQRDSAIVGLSAQAAIASATQLYLRYEGEVGGTTDNHALTAGLRMSW
jgi:uncharacterized protein with beta-barrel porin domain